METVLVTGGAGFIGFHVAKALLERGDKVIIVDNFNDYYDPKLKEDRIKQIEGHENLVVCRCDIADFDLVDKIFCENKITKICHLAAQPGVRYSIENPFAYERAYVLGTLNMLELARKHGVKDFVFASSSSVYGGNEKVPFSESDRVDKPISLYAATKRADELMAYTYHHLYGLRCTGLRFFTVYGPWGRPDMAYFKFTKAAFNGESIDVFNSGKMSRDFTYITDIVSGVVAAIDKPSDYEIFNLGNSKPVELMYFIELIEKFTGKKIERNMQPMQPGDVHKTFADVALAKEKLGYGPKTSIEDGLKLFVEWYRGHYDEQ